MPGEESDMNSALLEAEDFGAALTPELRAKETTTTARAWRAATETH
jgi:hypothetical protein